MSAIGLEDFSAQLTSSEFGYNWSGQNPAGSQPSTRLLPPWRAYLRLPTPQRDSSRAQNHFWSRHNHFREFCFILKLELEIWHRGKMHARDLGSILSTIKKKKANMSLSRFIMRLKYNNFEYMPHMRPWVWSSALQLIMLVIILF